MYNPRDYKWPFLWYIFSAYTITLVFLPDRVIAALLLFFGKCCTKISPRGPINGTKKKKKQYQNVCKHTSTYAHLLMIKAKI